MAIDAHANFGVSSVAVAPSPATTGTSLTVATGEGTRFPAAPFNATVAPSGVLATPANAEIVRVTARSGDVLTITRAQEGSVARAVVVGDLCVASITAKALQDIETGYARLDASNTFTTNQGITAGSPIWVMEDTVSPANGKKFYLWNTAQQFRIAAFSDAGGLMATPIACVRTGDVEIGKDIYEKQRTTALGHLIDTPFNASDYFALSPMTFTVSSGQVFTNSYSLAGRCVNWNIVLSGGSLGGSASNTFSVRLPAGMVSARDIRTAGVYFYGTTGAVLQTKIGPSATQLDLQHLDGSNFALGTCYVYFQVQFWI
jgi:hypothetical protein